MKKGRKNLLLELQKVARHFGLNFSKIEIVRRTAIALDVSNKRLLIMDEKDHPYFQTIDINNIDGCPIKVDYRSINAGDLVKIDQYQFL